MKRLCIVVHGVVQGVNYRASAAAEASRLGLVGHARNLPDGSVEIVAEGEEFTLNQLMDWAKNGPQGARVTDIDPSWSDASGEFASFDVKA